MSRKSITARIAAAATGASLFFLIAASVVQAAEIKLLTSVALTSALGELAPQYEHASGNKLTIGYSLIADLKKRILAGETADVIVLSPPAMEELQKQGKLAPGALVNVASTAVAVVVRAGAAKPDIGSVDAFKRTLLAAKSIAYADPAKGGASGVYFAKVLDRLGIAEQMQPKTVLVPGPQAAEVVAKGEAELGISAASEVVPVAGAQLVGPLPGELASATYFAAGLGVGTKMPEEAKSLIRFLTGPAAATVFKAKGFEPG